MKRSDFLNKGHVSYDEYLKNVPTGTEESFKEINSLIDELHQLNPVQELDNTADYSTFFKRQYALGKSSGDIFSEYCKIHAVTSARK